MQQTNVPGCAIVAAARVDPADDLSFSAATKIAGLLDQPPNLDVVKLLPFTGSEPEFETARRIAPQASFAWISPISADEAIRLATHLSSAIVVASYRRQSRSPAPDGFSPASGIGYSGELLFPKRDDISQWLAGHYDQFTAFTIKALVAPVDSLFAGATLQEAYGSARRCWEELGREAISWNPKDLRVPALIDTYIKRLTIWGDPKAQLKL